MPKQKVATPAYLKKWRAANPERVQARIAKVQEARRAAKEALGATTPKPRGKLPPEQLRANRQASNRAYRAKNKARIAEQRKGYFSENQAKYAAYSQVRKAAKANAIVGWSDPEHDLLLARKAKEWSAILGCALQVDHVVPLRSPIVCGLHVPANLQLLDSPLNAGKGNRTWPDMPE